MEVSRTYFSIASTVVGAVALRMARGRLRQEAALILQAMNEGQCGLSTGELVPLTQKLLEVEGQLIATALNLELQDGVPAKRYGDGERLLPPGWADYALTATHAGTSYAACFRTNLDRLLLDLPPPDTAWTSGASDQRILHVAPPPVDRCTSATRRTIRWICPR